MKDPIAITVSDNYGSRYYSIRKSTKTLFYLVVFGAGLAIIGSLWANFNQNAQNKALTQHNQQLETELLSFDIENSKLNQNINKSSQLIENISKELVEIEKISDVESADQALSLEQRLRLLADFYREKDEEYSEIGDRVQHIEGLIGLAEMPQNDARLTARVELASLTASHEKILYDSIPNGFPTKVNIITSQFGSRIHPVTKIKSFHKGVDLRAEVGDRVISTADGIVREAGYSELSGRRVVIQHNLGFETRYSHLDQIDVEPGDIVHKGDLIGFSGETGRVDAPHLHYEIRYLGKSINPDQFLKWEFGSHEIFTNVRGIKWPSLISLINKQITHQTLQLSLLEPASSVR
jgi:murein DD-endopeptidase MepM/ murein hydrolase activator NlpD